VATTKLSPTGYDEQRGRAFYAQLIERVRALPAVESASLAGVALLTGGGEGVCGWGARADAESICVGLNTVGAAYFETLRIPLIAGRGFDARDVAGAPRVMVVNQTFANQLWPKTNPIGREVIQGADRYIVVGLTRDGTYVSFGEDPRAFIFLPAEQRYTASRVLHVRTRPGVPAGEMIAALRREVAALDADVALELAMPLPVAVDFMLFPQRFAAYLIGSFGAIGLILAGIGVYGVLTSNVAQRARELGIRIALGADTRRLLTLVVGQSALLATIGAVFGLISAAAVARLLRGFLFGISPLDPITFAAVPVLLGLVALFASYHPARRALTIDPMETLRQE
jgi:predicted permease